MTQTLYTVTTSHPAAVAPARHTFRVSETTAPDGARVFYASCACFGCSRDYDTARAAIRGLARDNGATVLHVEPAPEPTPAPEPEPAPTLAPLAFESTSAADHFAATFGLRLESTEPRERGIRAWFAMPDDRAAALAAAQAAQAAAALAMLTAARALADASRAVLALDPAPDLAARGNARRAADALDAASSACARFDAASLTPYRNDWLTLECLRDERLQTVLQAAAGRLSE